MDQHRWMEVISCFGVSTIVTNENGLALGLLCTEEWRIPEILLKITVALLTMHKYEIIQEHLHGSDSDWIVGGDVLIEWGTHHCANQIWNCSTAVTQMMEVNFLVTLECHSKSVWKGFQGGKERHLKVSLRI